MGEEIAKIGPEANIEIIEYHAGKVRSRLFITPQDGAYLARGLLACAAVLCGPDPPQAGTIFADSHIPVLKWAANASHSELVLTTDRSAAGPLAAGLGNGFAFYFDRHESFPDRICSFPVHLRNFPVPVLREL